MKVTFDKYDSSVGSTIIRFKRYLRYQYFVWCSILKNALPRWMRPWPREAIPHGEVCNWITAPIRGIIVHPSCEEKKALLKCDETVLYYQRCTNELGMSYDATRFLVSQQQKGIGCGAFRPCYEPTQLAVGGERGICLWHVPHPMNKYNVARMKWIQCCKDKFDDSVMELQWFQDGSYLACTIMRDVQIWDPDAMQLLQIFEMPEPESYMWMLRFKPDMQHLLASLANTGYYCPSLSLLNCLLTHNRQLQTATWTNSGRHLLFAAFRDSRIFITSPRSEKNYFICPNKPTWYTEVVLELSCVECLGEYRYCTDPIALAIDSLDMYVAIMFKHLPFVLLCQLKLMRIFPSELTPLRFIDRQPKMAMIEVYPTCFSFNAATTMEETLLFIAWTNGDNLIETVIPSAMPPPIRNYVPDPSMAMDVDMDIELDEVEMEARSYP